MLKIEQMVQGVELVTRDGDVFGVQGTIGDIIFYIFLDSADNKQVGFNSIQKLNIWGWTIKEKIWSPKDLEVDSKYYYVDSGGTVEWSTFKNDYIDQWRIASGNCFQDEKSAEDYKQSVLEKNKS